MMEKIGRIKGNEGVSEIIGTVLLLAIAVIIFSSLIIYVLSMESSPSAPNVHMVGSMDENSLATIENRGGDSIPIEDLEVAIRKGNNQSHTFSGGALSNIFHDTNDNGRWDVADYIAINCSSIFGEVARWQISVAIIDEPSNSIIMSGVLQQGILHKMPPVAMFEYEPPNPKVGRGVVFNASESYDPDGGTIDKYVWNFDDGSSPVTKYDPVATHQYSQSGVYNVTLTVTDDEGQTGSITAGVGMGATIPPVNVTKNKPPVAIFTNTSEGNGWIFFDASQSYDPDGSVIKYIWDFGDGHTEIKYYDPTIRWHYAQGGIEYNVTLTVEDNDGELSSLNSSYSIYGELLYVPPIPPIAVISVPADISTAQIATFDGSDSYDPDNDDLVNYSWWFTKGSISDTTGNPDREGITVTYQFQEVGNYTITLRVNDSSGGVGWTNQTVYVRAPIAGRKFLIVDNTPHGRGYDGINNIVESLNIGDAYDYGKAIDQDNFYAFHNSTGWHNNSVPILSTVLDKYDIVIWSTGDFPGDGGDAYRDGNANTWTTSMTEGSDDTSDHVYEIAEHLTHNGTLLLCGTYAARDLQDYSGNGINPSERSLGNRLGLVMDTGGIDFEDAWEEFADDYYSNPGSFYAAPFTAKGTINGIADTSSGGAQGLANIVFDSEAKMYGLNKQSGTAFNYSLEASGGGTFLNENFEGTFLPSGWSQEEAGEWRQRYQSEAGGTSPEAELIYYNINGDHAYLDTKPVDTSGTTALSLEFKSDIDNYYGGGGYSCIVYVRSDASDTWTDITPWSNPITSDPSPQTYSIDITSKIGTGTQVRFEFIGDNWGIEDWSIDDVKVTSSQIPSGKYAIDAANVDNRSIVLGFDLNDPAINDTSRAQYLLNAVNWMAEAVGYPTTIYVDNNKPDPWYDDTHVNSIQQAVERVMVGGTIYVNGTGIPYGSVKVVRTVNIIGRNVGNGYPSITANGDYAIRIPVDWTSVSNFTITNSGTLNKGIYLEGSSSATINDCSISNTEYGLYGHNSNYLTICNNTLSGNTYNLYLDHSIKTEIEDNDIYSGDYGISTAYLYQSYLRSNDIFDNTMYGIYFSYSEDNYMQNSNDIYCNGYGIYLSYSSDNALTGSTINDSTNSGIYFSYSTNNQITSNEIRNNTQGINAEEYSNGLNIFTNEICHNTVGIKTLNTNSVTVYDNNISRNQEENIKLSSSNNNIISYNRLNHSNYGIYATSSISNEIRGNILCNNSYGLFFISSTDTEITDNTIYNATKAILLEDSHPSGGDNNISKNEIYNSSYGIELTSSSKENFILNNTIYDISNYSIIISSLSSDNQIKRNNILNVAHGIYVQSSNRNNISHNNLSSTSYSGILINSADDNAIINNTILNIPRGISLSSGCNDNSLKRNTIRNNTGEGIYISSSYYTTVLNNTIFNNSGDGILLQSSDTNSVINNTIWNSLNGIHLVSSGGIGNTIQSNTVYSNTNHGIYLENSRPATTGNNEVINNTVHDNGGNGVHLYTSKGNSIQDNRLYSNQRGISLQSSNSNSVFNNTVYANAYGIFLSSSTANTIGSNTEGGNRLYGHTDTGIYLCLSSDNNIIDNNTLWENTQGIALSNSDTADIKNNHLYWHNSSAAIKVVSSALGSSFPIRNNRVDNNSIGIEIRSSNGTHVESGNIISDNERGIYIVTSGSCIISGNTLSSNTDEGIYMYASTYQRINGNVVSNSTYGIYLNASTTSSEEGIHDNLLEYNDWGIYINDTASGNLIKENTFTIAPSHYGVYIIGSNCKNNKVYSNNFENTSYRDTSLCYDDGGGNSWYDEQHPDTVGGNYWANYEARYPGEDDSGKFWPVYYEIAPDADEEDFRPLVEPV